MANATEMNTSVPMLGRSQFRLQMEGLATAGLYAFCFGSMHLASNAPLFTTRAAAIFFGGLIAVPLLVGLPLALLRGMLLGLVPGDSSVAAFLPFARFSLYALQAILIWIATREAYAYFFTTPAPVF